MEPRVATEMEPAADARPVEIDIDGLTVRGQVRDGDANWIVLLHEPGADLDVWGDLPRVINRSGYSVLAVDLPGHGLSDDPWEPRRAVDLIDALAQFAISDGAAKIFVIASGELAAAALMPKRVNAAVALSPPPPIAFPDQTPPALILVGGSDSGAAASAEAFFRATRGWAAVSSFGTDEQGAALYRSSWSRHALEQTLAFFHDYRAD